MMNRSDKFKLRKGLRRMNKISFLAIILFLMISLVHYMEIDPILTGTIVLIKCLIIFIGIGGVENMISLSADRMSDGIDLPGVDL